MREILHFRSDDKRGIFLITTRFAVGREAGKAIAAKEE
jgi:hypothetical protein